MSWGTVTQVGAATGTSGATVVVTNCTVPAGALIVVSVVEVGADDPGASVTDGASNSYSEAVSSESNTGLIRGSMFFAWNVSALSAKSITFHKIFQRRDERNGLLCYRKQINCQSARSCRFGDWVIGLSVRCVGHPCCRWRNVFRRNRLFQCGWTNPGLRRWLGKHTN